MPRASPPLPKVQRSSCPYFCSPPVTATGRTAGSRQRKPRAIVPGDSGSIAAITSLLCAALRSLLQEWQQQVDNLLGLFLLHPVAGAIDQVATEHPRAGALLHRLIDAGALIRAPVLLARDETGGHVDMAARPGFELGGERARGAAAIPLLSLIHI